MIRNWPIEDRPREKLCRKGPSALTDSELLAILLRTGIKGSSALDLGKTLLQRFKTFRAMGSSDFSDWDNIRGIGPGKAAQIKAALEIGRRVATENAMESSPVIASSSDAARILMPPLRDLKRETVLVIWLDSANRVITIDTVAEGSVNSVEPLIKEIFGTALRRQAISLICAHNHPSGNPLPSGEDTRFTETLCQAGEVLGIPVLDHIIIGDNVYYSFLDEKGLATRDLPR